MKKKIIVFLFPGIFNMASVFFSPLVEVDDYDALV